MRQFYIFSKGHSLSDQLTWTHYRKLLPIKNDNEIEYYINIVKQQNLSVRELENKIKSLCKDHWEPTGGISICQDDSHFGVFQ